MDAVTPEILERCAVALYWVGFEERGAAAQRPGLLPEQAWRKAGPVQQAFCREQVKAVIRELAKS